MRGELRIYLLSLGRNKQIEGLKKKKIPKMSKRIYDKSIVFVLKLFYEIRFSSLN